MIEKLPTLNKIIKNLQQVPYLASKNLYRVVSHFLEMEDEQLKMFTENLMQAKQNIKKCEICCFWKEKQSECLFCFAPKRNKELVCVVETWQDLLAIERTGGYNGLYHVLGGAICPLEGIGPEDLTIQKLVNRAESLSEVVLALSQTPEGEATASYIGHKLENRAIKLTCLARGIPVGSSLQYMDRVTLHQALNERRPF